MARRPDPRRELERRIERRLACHQALHDPVREPRNRLPWLPRLRRWQAARLERDFAHFLADRRTRPAAEFFLSDIYGDHDFSRRDADIARVLPTMQRLLPEPMLEVLADALELGALTHALDLRMGQALQRLAPEGGELDGALYARAYREVGLPRLRERQIALVEAVGYGLGAALRLPGLLTLLKLSRAPARAAGLSELQGLLERGAAALTALPDIGAFMDEVAACERARAAHWRIG
ncbi:FFLEELY motif protein [Vulcaniibacterium gelatinicum]|uniref:FFLEELY motif protein n=1 Tax=Vulcaniibacterium gelatinicum TaxID=2598725 RepID=UPI0011CB6F0D|nr:hypothetical protein [Vulcaniibacterium gelatinicum]